MGATKLSIYNHALRNIGSRPLDPVTGLSEAVESRFYIDATFDHSVTGCLRAGFWNFAMRVARFDFPDLLAPAFDFTYAYTKPADWLRTRNMSASQTLNPQLWRFQDEGGIWVCDVKPLYVRYVSLDINYGYNFAAWPPDFEDYVAATIGADIFMQATGKSVAELNAFQKTVLEPARKRAMANDAMDGPAEIRPLGSWANARRVSGRVLAIRDGFIHIG